MAALNDFLSYPSQLYTPEQVKVGERIVAAELGIDLYQLMSDAGQAIFDLIVENYPAAKSILVCCGRGNNGGDGYTVARLLKLHGVQVELW